jgi:hypothetical protein
VDLPDGRHKPVFFGLAGAEGAPEPLVVGLAGGSPTPWRPPAPRACKA